MRFPCEELSDVCEIIMGQAPAGDAYNDKEEGYPLVAGAGDFGPLYPAVKKHTTEASKLSRAGDIILGIRASIGSKVLSDREYCLGRGVAGLRASPRLDSRYLWHWLEEVRVELLSKGRGATFLQVNRQDIRELQIPLPPLAEQKRIAAILDAADALRAKRREALAQLDALLQSTFLTLFGDPVAENWPVTTIEEVAAPDSGSIRTGPFGSQLLHSEFTNHGIAVLGIDNAVANEFRWGEKRFISEAKYKHLKRYTVRPGDVIITIMGTCGRCAVVPDTIPTAINTKHLCCITLDHSKCLPIFLHGFFLRHPMAKSYLGRAAKGAIMSGLNMGLIKSMPIPLPPLPLQQKFATIVESIERQKTTQRAHLAELDALFAALQHRAFRGEL
jgi:type I restriction enzyme, S subunit